MVGGPFDFRVTPSQNLFWMFNLDLMWSLTILTEESRKKGELDFMPYSRAISWISGFRTPELAETFWEEHTEVERHFGIIKHIIWTLESYKKGLKRVKM